MLLFLFFFLSFFFWVDAVCGDDPFFFFTLLPLNALLSLGVLTLCHSRPTSLNRQPIALLFYHGDGLAWTEHLVVEDVVSLARVRTGCGNGLVRDNSPPPFPSTSFCGYLEIALYGGPFYADVCSH